MIIQRVRCLLDRHTPVRNRVHSEGRRLTGTCAACGAPIWRRMHGEWRKILEQQDQSELV